MRKNFFKTFSWCLLLSIVLTSIFITFDHADRFIGTEDYFDSEEFKYSYNNFLDYLGLMELEVFDLENITINQSHIEDYRNRYGSLSDELSVIETEYNVRISEAQNFGNTAAIDALKAERDLKIDDIKKIFEDDVYVEEKIRAELNEDINSYLEQFGNDFYQFDYNVFSYELRNIETGETFSKGDVSENAAFSMTYNDKNGFLKLPLASNNTNIPLMIDLLLDGSSAMYEGKIIIPTSKTHLIPQYQSFYTERNITFSSIIIGVVILLIILFIFKLRKSWFKNGFMTHLFDKCPLEIWLLLFIFNAVVLTAFLTILMGFFNLFFYGNFQISLGILLSQIVVVFSLWFGIYQLVWIYEKVRDRNGLITKIKNSLIAKFMYTIQDAFAKTSVGIQVLLTLILIFVWGFLTTSIIQFSYYFDELVLMYVLFILFIGIPLLTFIFRKIGYLNRVFIATEHLVDGTLHDPVPEKGRSVIAKHAANLNKLRTGIKVSLSEQAKSERLKTELITNVSHDLRTPLTSIITYTDLLKNQELTEEERMEYVKILERKSNRLKILIEDLFEVSKMASGNLELHKQEVDLTQLLQQVLGEHQEQLEQSGLELRATIPETPVIANVDGQRWWRVLDNLIVNAMKYSIKGSRVYVSLKHDNGQAEFIIKNVTKYELGENINELLERFKRADKSRHTEGSGLGLAIAQSIVDLHGGLLKIELDGDLFKVTVQIATS
ncbi:sensor histidine kinase [Chengkuizengella marina]|uniref:histidine kinase n=1 Tax=Chengkuizengella marina TaxID=2507566 RepID=A0A6N9Q0W8_9BACL|nr:HAMP domain-containing sensor histidine kinase [Chengkuizengella marina]NBI28846.1 HAMP domain-containing histidine kinase [Chengkuizengella marina]